MYRRGVVLIALGLVIGTVVVLLVEATSGPKVWEVSEPLAYDRACHPAAEESCNGIDLVATALHGNVVLIVWDRQDVGSQSGVFFRRVDRTTGAPLGEQHRLWGSVVGGVGSLIARYDGPARAFRILWQALPVRKPGSRIEADRAGPVRGSLVEMSGASRPLGHQVRARRLYLREPGDRVDRPLHRYPTPISVSAGSVRLITRLRGGRALFYGAEPHGRSASQIGTFVETP